MTSGFVGETEPRVTSLLAAAQREPEGHRFGREPEAGEP